MDEIRNKYTGRFIEILCLAAIVFCAFSSYSTAQSTAGAVSKNIDTTKASNSETTVKESERSRVAATGSPTFEIGNTANSTSAKPPTQNTGSTGKGLDTIRPSSNDPTSIYRIGVNDVLSVELANVSAPAKTVKVMADGSIDFPLAGGRLIVAGKTPTEAASLLAGSIKLVKNPRVTLKVREYTSHTVTVWGLVDQPGEVQIQRDAVPFFVIRAGMNVDPRTNVIRIARWRSTTTEEYRLTNQSLSSILIFPGDSIEFSDGTDTKH